MSLESADGDSSFHYSFEDRTFKEVVAFSHDHLSRIGYMELEPLEGDRLYRIGMEGRPLGPVIAARLWSSPAVAHRTVAHVAALDTSHVTLATPMTTPMIVSRAGREDITINPGETFIWPGDEAASFSYGEDCVTSNVTLPCGIAEVFQSRFMTKITDNDACGLGLLRQYAGLALNQSHSSPGMDALAGQHLADLAIFALGSNRDERTHTGRNSVKAARLARIRADIAANLGNSDLSLEWLARRHGMRPRAIQDLFYAAGEGYVEFVRARRLDHAQRLLTDPRHASRNIAEIALASGFGDISWFNNAFRKRFGMTPSEARAAAFAIREGKQT